MSCRICGGIVLTNQSKDCLTCQGLEEAFKRLAKKSEEAAFNWLKLKLLEFVAYDSDYLEDEEV